MSVKSKYFLTVLLLVFLALIPSGCFFCWWAEDFCFDLTYPAESGRVLPLYSQKLYLKSVVIPEGWFYGSGYISQPVFSKSNAVVSIPSKLAIILSHRDATGKELEQRIYKLRVNKTTGKIRKQTFPFNAMTIKQNEEVRFSVKPTGDISPCSLHYTVKYTKQ